MTAVDYYLGWVPAASPTPHCVYLMIRIAIATAYGRQYHLSMATWS